MTRHHLTINGNPWCSWLCCAAGQAIAREAGARFCEVGTKAEADRAAKALRPHFKRGLVKVVAGRCPA